MYVHKCPKQIRFFIKGPQMHCFKGFLQSPKIRYILTIDIVLVRVLVIVID